MACPDWSTPREVHVATFRGLISYTIDELNALGFAPMETTATSARISASLTDCLRLNLALRTALNVNVLLWSGEAGTADALYEQIRAFPWEEWIPTSTYFTVIAHANTPAIDNTMFASLKVKDAIADRCMETLNERPDSGPDRHRVVLHLFWHGTRAWLYLSTAGRKLADRGYRKRPGPAPLRENLAAALLAEAGYTGAQALVLPMIGSGTLAIEAALMAQRRAPGLLRDNYGLMYIHGFERSCWQALRKELQQQSTKELVAPIVASDLDREAIEAARHNARTAGVEHLIEWQTCDFAKTRIPETPGLLFLNPPYGARLGDRTGTKELYARIGDWLKQSYAGWSAHVLTGNMELAKAIGLRASKRTVFYNGKIECRLLRYEMYQGSK